MKILLIIIWTTINPITHEVLVFETKSYEDCVVYATQIQADGAMTYCRGVRIK